MNARSADFAATAPWGGIQGKPSEFPSSPARLSPGSARDRDVLIWSAALNRWVPTTPGDLMAILRQFLTLSAADVGLDKVDNTSDETKNSALATLTNKTLLGAIIRLAIELGIRSPTGFNLFLTTDSAITTDRTLTLRLDDVNRAIELRASLVLAGNDTLTMSVNGAPRLVDLEGDLTLRGGDLVVELSDGTGAGEDRTLSLAGDLTLRGGNLIVELSDGTGSGENRILTLTRDLSLIGGGSLTVSIDTDTVLNFNGDVTLSGPFTTVGASTVILTFTGITVVTFPTSGVLATLDGVETFTNKTLTAPQINSPTGIVKGDVGLGNVDDTADANKPVSTAQAAADATKQPLTGNSFTVAGLPAANANVGRVVYCTNGNAGAPCAAISDGTNWKVILIGATVS